MPNLRCLINRAKALMETKDKLSQSLMEMEVEISTETEAVEKMNDEKMIRALNSNVKLGCLQSVFEQVKEEKNFCLVF